jgi:hyperosmotically inducible periplasmic protein
MRNSLAVLLLSGLLLGAYSAGAQEAGATAPDNTGINARDRAANAVTADQQSQTGGDVKLTQRIRRAITKDHSLSTMAKNVKVVSIDGEVTLRGPVKTAKERARIASKARAIAGVNKVDNQLEIAGT